MQGLKRAWSRIPSPRAAEDFTSPSSPWLMRFVSSNAQLNSWDYAVLVATVNVTLPPNPAVGDQVRVQKQANGACEILAANSQKIAAGTNVTLANSGGSGALQEVLLEYVGPVTNPNANVIAPGGMWVVRSTQGGELYPGYWNQAGNFTGTLAVGGVLTANGGTNSSGSTGVSTPTITGSPVQISATKDSNACIQFTASGTASIWIGPGSSLSTSYGILGSGTYASPTAVAVVAGQEVTVPVPAGWYIAVVQGATATWTTVAFTH